MPAYVALLRAVNVGGTGKLAMADLKAICESAGFEGVRTFIASGNVVFRADRKEAEVKRRLEARLQEHAGRAVGVLVRTAEEMARVVAGNPFTDAPGNRVVAIFLDQSTGAGTLDGLANVAEDEKVKLGRREIYVHYGAGMGRSKLRIPAAERGTARNMNTITTLAQMASALEES